MSCETFFFFFWPSLAIMTFEHDRWSLSSWGYLYGVLSFFTFPMVAAWFVWWQGKSWVRLDSVHTNQGVFRTLAQREGANIIHLPILHQLKTLVNGPSLLWQLPWGLFITHRTLWHCINHITKFQGQSDIFGNMPSHPGATMAALHMHPSCYIRTPQRCCRFGSRPLQ